MISSFKYLENSKRKIATGCIICLYDNLMKMDEKNYIIPISSVINVTNDN